MSKSNPVFTFGEAIKELNIEEYGLRIFNSNSCGELFHLRQYVYFANLSDDHSWFKPLFEAMVADAKENWDRPASVFQHIDKVDMEYYSKHPWKPEE